MPGLNLGAGGGVRASMGNGMSSSPAPTTATQAAFGSGGYPSTINALTPNDPFGVAFWASVVAAGLLLWIRHSLPA